jgi:hypothetical protein
MSKRTQQLANFKVAGKFRETSVAFMVSLALASCGGGDLQSTPTNTASNVPFIYSPNLVGTNIAGGTSTTSQSSVVSNDLVISGTVATGAALVNATVTAKCSAGQGTGVSSAQGTYSIRILDGALPCIISAVSADALTKLNSAIEDSGDRAVTANVSTLTQLVFDQVNAQANGALIDNFSFEKSKVTATLLNQAKQKVRESLAPIVNLSGLDPIKDVLVAQSATTIGNAHDLKLDALRDKLAAAQITLPTLTQIMADNANGSIPEVIKTSIQAVSADCPGFRTGTYRVIEPANATPVYNITFNAQTLSATSPFGTVTLKAEGCKLTSPDGTVTVIGPQGAGVMRTAAGTLAAVMPLQNLSLAELQGTWNYVTRARETGTAYVGMWGEMQIDGVGRTTRRENCTAVACSVLSGTQLPTFTANTDGSFSNSSSEKFYAFRAPTGALALVGIASTSGTDIGKIFFAKKGAATELAQLDRFYKRADISLSAAGVVGAAFDQTEYLVTSVNTTDKTFNRRFFGSCREDTLQVGAPFSQMFNRSIATTNPCTKATNVAAPFRALSATGLGVTAYVVNADVLGFSVIEQPTEQDSVRGSIEKMLVSGNGYNSFISGLPLGPNAAVATTANSNFYLKRGFDKIASPALGTQSTIARITNASNSLAMPSPSADDRYSSVVLKAGALYRNYASQAQMDIRYEGPKVLQDWIGVKLTLPAVTSAPASTVMWTDQLFALPSRKLAGSVSSVPAQISFDQLFTSIYTSPNLLTSSFSTRQWNPGSAYYRVGVVSSSERYSLADCVEGSTSFVLQNPSDPLKCAVSNVASTTIEQVLSSTLGYGGLVYQLAQGDISTREGVRMWVSKTPELIGSTARYRMYFELVGKVYAGSYITAGSTNFSTTSGGANTDVVVRYNDAAVDTLKSVFAF